MTTKDGRVWIPTTFLLDEKTHSAICDASERSKQSVSHVIREALASAFLGDEREAA